LVSVQVSKSIRVANAGLSVGADVVGLLFGAIVGLLVVGLIGADVLGADTGAGVVGGPGVGSGRGLPPKQNFTGYIPIKYRHTNGH
jgi:hypothetical protein